MNYFSNPERLSKLLQLLWDGMQTSLSIFFVTLLISLPLGLLVCVANMSKLKILRWPMSVFILIMRGTPLMLQLFAIYFFLPSITGPIPRLYAVYIAFGINYAAYFAEIYRGGLMSIPVGQQEASKVLGLSKAQTFFHVLLPQTIKRIILPISNEVITLVKDTSLATAIAVSEMFLVAKNATSASGSIEPLFIAGLFYLVWNTIVSVVFNKLIQHFEYYRG